MGFWTTVLGLATDVEDNGNDPGAPAFRGGDADGLEIQHAEFEGRSVLPFPQASGWNGWPAEWATPRWQTGGNNINTLVDIAWTCLDLNANIISSMPVYQTRGDKIVAPEAWMYNPDPTIYSSWQEFAKQAFWDFMMGEVFIMSWAEGSDGYPLAMRVVPPWLVTVDLVKGRREYKIGSEDVTDKMLHIRYQSNTSDARGHGPLEMLGARQTMVRLLQKYANTLAETGGIPLYWLEIERRITATEGQDLIDRWIETRTKNAGHPALVSGGAKLHQANSMNAQDMSLLELSQFSESRIAVAMGVPPFLVGLAGAAGSLTYSNIADLFDYHDRSSLRPKVTHVMNSLSQWALPRGREVELNRDDYTRLPFDKRIATYVAAIEAGILTVEEVRIRERFYGEPAARALTGGAS